MQEELTSGRQVQMCTVDMASICIAERTKTKLLKSARLLQEAVDPHLELPPVEEAPTLTEDDELET